MNVKKIQKVISIITTLVVMSGILCGCTAESAKETSTEPLTTHEAVDISTIRAQDDYYGYINAEHLLDTLPAYGEMTWGTFEEVDAQTVQEIFELIGDIAKSEEEYKLGSAEYLIKNVYTQAMAFDDNAAVYSEIRHLCDEINNVQSIEELMELWKGAVPFLRSGILPFLPMVRQDYFKSGEYALLIDQKAEEFVALLTRIYPTVTMSVSA